METHRYKTLYLQVPLHIGYRMEALDFTFSFSAGVYGAYGISGKQKREYIYVNTRMVDDDGSTAEEGIINIVKRSVFSSNFFGGDNGFKRFDMGLGLVAGFEWRRMGINVGYDHGLVNIAPSRVYAPEYAVLVVSSNNPKVRNRNGYIALTYRF